MLYLIDIHWKRRTPHPDKPQTGRTTYAIASKYPKRAINQAKKTFTNKYGANLEITDCREKQDPAGIFR